MRRDTPADEGEGAGFLPRPITVRSAAVQIADQLRAAIADGTWRPGDRLPSEHRLAEAYGVSRGTIREASRILAATHLVESTRGAAGGTFVTLPQADVVARQMGELIALWFRAGNVSVAEVNHARDVLERECVRLAALNRTEDDLAAIRRPVEDSRNTDLTSDEWLANDLEFHTAISKAARNHVLELAMTSVHLVRPKTNALLHRVLEREPVLQQHWKIYEAIRDRDPEGAVAAFTAHFDHLSEVQHRALADRDSSKVSVADITEEDRPAPDVLRRRRTQPPGAPS